MKITIEVFDNGCTVIKECEYKVRKVYSDSKFEDVVSEVARALGVEVYFFEGIRGEPYNQVDAIASTVYTTANFKENLLPTTTSKTNNNKTKETIC